MEEFEWLQQLALRVRTVGETFLSETENRC